MNAATTFNPSQHGTVAELEDGRVSVIFERQLSHSVEKVWRAITDAGELATWFPGIKFEAKQGTEFNIWFGGDCEGPAHVTGLVEVCDPPNVLQLGTMRYELAPNNGGCLLRFTDILYFEGGGDRTRQELAVSVLGGWHNYLDKLEAAMAGTFDGQEKPEPDYANITVPGWEIL